MYGKRRTAEQRAVLAERTREWLKTHPHPMQGRKHNAETRRQLSESHKGLTNTMTPEGAERRRLALVKMWADPAHRAKRRAALLNRKLTA